MTRRRAARPRPLRSRTPRRRNSAGGVAAPAASNETSRAIDGAETERRENRRWLITGTLIALGVIALAAVLLLAA